MKKVLFVAILAFASVMAYAQPRAIGGRLGAFDGVSYQHGFGENNMLEIEAGFSIDGRMDYWYNESNVRYHDRAWGNSIQAAVTYDWIDPFGAKFPWEHKGEWHWYMGVGAAGGYGWNLWGYGSYAGYGVGYGYRCDWGFIGGAGRVGVEYDFWFPLQLSVDWRPTLGAALAGDGNGNVMSGLYWEVSSIALGVRYKF
jgi:hypothetical protein